MMMLQGCKESDDMCLARWTDTWTRMHTHELLHQCTTRKLLL